MNIAPELQAELEALIGQVALQELEAAKPIYTESLIAWARTLSSLTDDELVNECESTIFESALAQSFRGNWEHAHCKASACYTEARRRHVATGHSEDCRGDTLYSRGYRRVVISQGHTPPSFVACTCT